MQSMRLRKMSKNKQIVNERELTANQFTNVKDIKGNFLFSKDGYLFGYLRVFPYNLDLLAIDERRIRTQNLSLSFEGDRKDFDYCAFPRELDLDDYKNYLKKQYQEELSNYGKRQILAIMIRQAAELSSSGENYEHHHYFKIWARAEKNINDTKKELLTRLEEFKQRYSGVGIDAEILNETEIFKLCNLFTNSQQVSFMSSADNPVITPIPMIKDY